jgi:hypothetical protein
MKQFDFNAYTKNNPLFKETTIEEATATFTKGKMYIDRTPSQRAYIKGVGKNIKDLNSALSTLRSTYNVNSADMKDLVQAINNVISGGNI